MSFVQISIDFSFALRAFVRENRCLEPRTSSLIIPGCEKKWKKGQIRDFAGSNLILNNKPREKKKISNLVLARGKTLCNDSVTASSSTYDRRSSLSLSPWTDPSILESVSDEDKREQNERHSRCSLLSRTTLLLIVVLCNCHDQLWAASWAVCHDHDSLFNSSHTTPHTSLPI